MTTPAEMIRRLQAIDFEDVMVDSVELTKGELVKQNLDQMYDGKQSSQQPISPLYAPRTVKEKKRKGQPYDRVTLKDKGNLYAKAGAIVDNEVVRLGSDVPYADAVEKKYGKDIWGLGGPYKVEYVEKLDPVFVGTIREKTGMV